MTACDATRHLSSAYKSPALGCAVGRALLCSELAGDRCRCLLWAWCRVDHRRARASPADPTRAVCVCQAPRGSGAARRGRAG